VDGYGSCAVHFHSLRFIYLLSFMLIYVVVTEICSTQNSTMKHLQRAITLKLGSGGLYFFSLTEIYTSMTFHVQICNILWDITPTSLWRTDGQTSGHPDTRTNSRTDNAKSKSFRLRRGIINTLFTCFEKKLCLVLIYQFCAEHCEHALCWIENLLNKTNLLLNSHPRRSPLVHTHLRWCWKRIQADKTFLWAVRDHTWSNPCSHL